MVKTVIAFLEAEQGDSGLRELLHGFQDAIGETATIMPLKPGDVWADGAIADLQHLDVKEQHAWNGLLHACAGATSDAPTEKWRKSLRPYIEVLGTEPIFASLRLWFPLVDQPRPVPLPRSHEWKPDHPLLIQDTNGDILKGLTWLARGEASLVMPRTLAALALSAYRKIPGVGPGLTRVGNACIWALGEMPGQHALAHLAILKVKVRFGTAERAIESAMLRSANRLGLPPSEIEELIVPTYGLDPVGLRTETLGDVTATIQVDGPSRVSLQWQRTDGKRLAAVSRAVKEGYADGLAELTTTIKDLKKMLPAQRDRLEALYLEQKTWALAPWQERYLDHPLVGVLARRIIWNFQTAEQRVPAIFWHDGTFVGSDGNPIPVFSEDTTVTLWHPLDDPTEAVLAWRAWLTTHEVQQPFKQASREVYVVTDAERRTRLYSNRFAAHILRQHQFNTLAGVRRWKSSLRLMVDDEYGPPERRLPHWGMRAEFWVEGTGETYGVDTTETGAYLYLTTDQVRFYTLDAPQHGAHAAGGGYHLYLRPGETAVDLIPQEDVPPLVFSEIMRDVDLFVGIASIGNDPSWLDGGLDRPHQAYWNRYAFGELAETAKMCREVLQNIVPRLKIHDRCTMTDRFLVVRGNIRTYKIHIGSGNILMEPNDHYLCIIPGGGEAAAIPTYIPFEGDRTLAIILSKVLLLANDTAITDPTITRQLTQQHLDIRGTGLRTAVRHTYPGSIPFWTEIWEDASMEYLHLPQCGDGCKVPLTHAMTIYGYGRSATCRRSYRFIPRWPQPAS